MPVIRYDEPLNVLVAARGHPYQRDAFMGLFDGLEGVAASLVEQPAAARLMTPAGMRGFDVLVLYDMPGLRLRRPDRELHVEPPPEFRQGFLELLDEGRVGIVALHHAIAGWPAWPRYAELLGGRFLYAPHGAEPDSGYRHEVTHTIEVLEPAHPVTAGLGPSFTLTDELYLYRVFEDRVRPLLRSRHAFVRDNFYSADLALKGRLFENAGWDHPPGSDLVGWVKRAGNCPLVYLQPGDGPPAYEAPVYRRLVENAVRWAGSEAARAAVEGLPG